MLRQESIINSIVLIVSLITEEYGHSNVSKGCVAQSLSCVATPNLTLNWPLKSICGIAV